MQSLTQKLISAAAKWSPLKDSFEPCCAVSYIPTDCIVKYEKQYLASELMACLFKTPPRSQHSCPVVSFSVTHSTKTKASNATLKRSILSLNTIFWDHLAFRFSASVCNRAATAVVNLGIVCGTVQVAKRYMT